MLFTRCPECDTTFRVTDETLKKASGQVRCGRCASVFNAYAELHDPAAKSSEPEQPRARSANAAAAPTAGRRSGRSPPSRCRRHASPEPSTAPSRPPTGIGSASVADVVAETKRRRRRRRGRSARRRRERRRPQAISADGSRPRAAPRSTSRVAAARVRRGREPASRRTAQAAGGPSPPRSRCSRSARKRSITFAPTSQGIATFGPWLTATYKTLGGEIAPSWDVHQYEIIDWVATAEPNARGLGSLKITARIQNRGPLRQPYPAVQLRLKDRWEAAVGSRMFTPAEYLPRDTPRGRLMSPGETARAEIEVVDPGPDAYGFELDVCIEVEASLVTCGTDEVFL